MAYLISLFHLPSNSVIVGRLLDAEPSVLLTVASVTVGPSKVDVDSAVLDFDES